ncbi:glucosidase II beta subunit-like protein [Dictyocaulus viviparus]|uniref:Endoplasmic reticulum lectin 1 n=1 Tax=Dictyocaulus viviparus TaxID=29172 RepID=A0A0D8XJ08_DICVI|nr:glucosidase II beta subunit-like protein [Dictyocaulus viviparus]
MFAITTTQLLMHFYTLEMKLLCAIFSVILNCVITAKVDDSVHYFITFDRTQDSLAGTQLLEENEKALSEDSLRVSTQNNENFICKIPEGYTSSNKDASINTESSVAELIASIYKEKLCSYRVEPYWTYELCHGRYIVQYHEEKDVRGVGRTSEYYLGNLHVDYGTVSSPNDHNIPPKRIIDGEEHPYFPVLYNQGTTCDITGKPRTTVVKYICDENLNIQIYSLSEVSSCNYEVVVLTNRICSHPAYRPRETKNKEIICYSSHSSGSAKPLSLVQLEEYHRDTFKREFTITSIHNVPESTQGKKTIEDVQRRYERQKLFKLSGEKKYQSIDTLANNRLVVEDTVNRIISGSECIYGGEGWWKYEFCYGKSVVQYHQEPNGDRTDILLGVFDETIHKAWVDDDKIHRSPKKIKNQITQVSHLYSKGDICHELNAHSNSNFTYQIPGGKDHISRSVEVRLKCKTAGSPLAISLSLVEPNLCQYILMIESERFCEPLQYADEYGHIALELANESKVPGFKLT